MKEALTNLLPYERRRALKREYWFRLGVVALLLCTILIGIAAVLLVPSYIYLSGSARTKAARLASITSSETSTEEQALAQRLALLQDNTQDIVALSKRISVSKTANDLLVLPRPGITLSGFTYTAAEEANASIFSLTGVAATRDALRKYQLALQNISFVRAAELPVSAYAKDTNIAFTITVTLTQ